MKDRAGGTARVPSRAGRRVSEGDSTRSEPPSGALTPLRPRLDSRRAESVAGETGWIDRGSAADERGPGADPLGDPAGRTPAPEIAAHLRIWILCARFSSHFGSVTVSTPSV